LWLIDAADAPPRGAGGGRAEVGVAEGGLARPRCGPLRGSPRRGGAVRPHRQRAGRLAGPREEGPIPRRGGGDWRRLYACHGLLAGWWVPRGGV
jgi:hypothetical protein